MLLCISCRVGQLLTCRSASRFLRHSKTKKTSTPVMSSSLPLTVILLKVLEDIIGFGIVLEVDLG